MTVQETPIIVHLDLSYDKSLSIAKIEECIPGRPRVKHIVRASESGAPQTDDGSPDRLPGWAACREAVARLAAKVNRIASELSEQGETVRLWIGGSAGLPVFFHLGLELSGWSSPVTLVHRDKQGRMYVFPLDRPAPTGRYFGESSTTTGSGDEVALVVSAARAIEPEQVAVYEAAWTDGFGPTVKLHAPDWLTEENFGIAYRELASATARVPSRPVLTVLLCCPTPLAFALGRSINRKLFGTISVPDYGVDYRPALILQRSAPRRRRRVSPELSVVFFGANSPKHQRLSLREEADRIERGLGQGKRDHRFERVMKTDPETFMETLRQKKPSVLHFSGHAEPGGIAFESNEHGHVVITPEMFAKAIKNVGDSVQVVVLNACHSAAMSAALLDHVDCVIGMSDTIDDDAAIAFASDFYRDLGCMGVRVAWENARNQMAMNRMIDHEIVTIEAAPGIDLDDVWP